MNVIGINKFTETIDNFGFLDNTKLNSMYRLFITRCYDGGFRNWSLFDIRKTRAERLRYFHWTWDKWMVKCSLAEAINMDLRRFS